jgi:hypothetical protein
MIAFVFQWLVKSMIGRIVAAALVGLVALSINNSWQRHKGAERIITNSIERGKAANERNAKIREKVKAPGAAERVLRNYCRDC